MAQKQFAHFKNAHLCRPQKCLVLFVEDEMLLRALVLFTDDKTERLDLDPQAKIGFEVPPIQKEIIGDDPKDKERARQKMLEVFETQMEEGGYHLKVRNSDLPKYCCYNMEPT
ncbi:hypothetical protein KJ840_01500 [Patescibacteria group bacterium]|nr:hypothetical protein [Patescibacteria group bacterium]